MYSTQPKKNWAESNKAKMYIFNGAQPETCGVCVLWLHFFLQPPNSFGEEWKSGMYVIHTELLASIEQV